MIILRRQDYLYKLCIACTLLMFTTTILNITYIIRRSLAKNHLKDDELSVGYIQSNNLTNLTEVNKEEIFDRIFQLFSYSFAKNYVPLLDNLSNMSLCSSVPTNLKGPIAIPPLVDNFTLLNSSSYHSDVRFGGSCRPKTCQARHKVAIIVPYRDRYDILKHFLFHTHTFLQRQELDYRIYVCEQAYDKTFNKGIVMNGCFKEILKLEPDTQCFIMHDVDLLLIDDRNMYTCPKYPRHLSVAIDKFHFYLPYDTLVGGVLGR